LLQRGKVARLDHQKLAEEATDLLLAALAGDDALASQLSASPGERYSPVNTDACAQDPVGAYLSSVTVKGFRGIGPATTLTVKEGPGLTLVVGRNGSGKSSFAEGLEVLLTGDLMRWKSAPTVVKDGWRCKHAVGDCEVTAEFYVEGKGKTTVGRSWLVATGSDISKWNAWVQVHGEKQAPFQTLGWDADLVEYRPFLSPMRSLKRSSAGRLNCMTYWRTCSVLRISPPRTSGCRLRPSSVKTSSTR